MSSKSRWTDRRLQRLFDRYNKTYWRGKLPQHTVGIGKLDNCFGECHYKNREITINIDEHHSDRKIRSTLLHEMTHAAAGFCGLDGHGYKFFAETEQLLRLRAPIDIGMSGTPGLRILADVVPRKFRRARKAMEKAEVARQRAVMRAGKNLPVMQLTESDIVRDFKDAAMEVTEREAMLAIGNEHGLLDVEGKPKSRWAARVLAKGRRAFRISRRDILQMKKLAAGILGG